MPRREEPDPRIGPGEDADRALVDDIDAANPWLFVLADGELKRVPNPDYREPSPARLPDR